MGLNRRGFLYGSVVVGSASVITAGLGRVLQRRFEIDDERSEISLPEPSSSGSTAGEFDFGIDGISPFVTSVDEFYRIDTAIVVPQVSKDSWSLKIGGMVDHEIELTFDDLLAREQVERYVTLSCVSNPVGGDLVGNGVWQGVMLADVLREAGVQRGRRAARQPVDRWLDVRHAGRRGHGRPRRDARDRAERATTAGRARVPGADRGPRPLRLRVGHQVGHRDRAHHVGCVRRLLGAERVGQGGARQDVDAASTSRGTTASRPPVRSRSVASRGRCIAGSPAVQVRIDGGEWLDGELAGVPSDDTWRQWRYTWDATPGEHVIEARAADGAGVVQEEERMSPAPNGAQGYHQIRVKVAVAPRAYPPLSHPLRTLVHTDFPRSMVHIDRSCR